MHPQYNISTMTYAEGLTLVKAARQEVIATQTALRQSRQPLEKQAVWDKIKEWWAQLQAKAPEWWAELKKQMPAWALQDSKTTPGTKTLSPTVLYPALGALGGAALGGFSGMGQPKGRGRPLSRMLTGGLVGGAGTALMQALLGGLPNASTNRAEETYRQGMEDYKNTGAPLAWFTRPKPDDIEGTAAYYQKPERFYNKGPLARKATIGGATLGAGAGHLGMSAAHRARVVDAAVADMMQKQKPSTVTQKPPTTYTGLTPPTTTTVTPTIAEDLAKAVAARKAKLPWWTPFRGSVAKDLEYRQILPSRPGKPTAPRYTNLWSQTNMPRSANARPGYSLKARIGVPAVTGVLGGLAGNVLDYYTDPRVYNASIAHKKQTIADVLDAFYSVRGTDPSKDLPADFLKGDIKDVLQKVIFARDVQPRLKKNPDIIRFLEKARTILGLDFWKKPEYNAT